MFTAFIVTIGGLAAVALFLVSLLILLNGILTVYYKDVKKRSMQRKAKNDKTTK